MSSMRYGWSGRPFVGHEGGGALVELHMLGEPHRFIEQLQEQAAPGFPRDTAANRWHLERNGSERTDLHVAGFQRHHHWPDPIPQLLSDVLQDCIVYGQAGVEWNVLEGKTGPAPALMHLPGESIGWDDAGAFHQRLKDGTAQALPRCHVLSLSPTLTQRLNQTLGALVDLAREDRQVMSQMPSLMLTPTKVNIKKAFDKLHLEVLRQTRDFGFIPMSPVSLSEPYWTERRFRGAEVGLAIRQELIHEFNQLLANFQIEPGLEGQWRIRFEERFSVPQLREKFQRGELDAKAVRRELDFDN